MKGLGSMKEQLYQRIQELKAEFESGRLKLADLETKQQNLKETLLRISGAIQVLDEELEKNKNNEGEEAINADGKAESTTSQT